MIAGRVFSDATLLERLNGLVHPAVERDFAAWAERCDGAARRPAYVVEEAAVLIESGGWRRMDCLVAVTAPVEVRVESFKETDSLIRIGAVIYVERESQKGIIIGHQGVALKKVSTESRKALEKFFGKNVWLEIFVKVDKDWRNSKRELDNFGYNPG